MTDSRKLWKEILDDVNKKTDDKFVIVKSGTEQEDGSWIDDDVANSN